MRAPAVAMLLLTLPLAARAEDDCAALAGAGGALDRDAALRCLLARTAALEARVKELEDDEVAGRSSFGGFASFDGVTWPDDTTTAIIVPGTPPGGACVGTSGEAERVACLNRSQLAVSPDILEALGTQPLMQAPR